MLIKNRSLLKLKSALRERVPMVYVWASRISANTVLFGDERRYLRGDREPKSELPSVVFFTCIRSASQYIDGIIARLYRAAGGREVNLPKYCFHGAPGRSPELRDPEKMRELLRPTGFYYGALRPFGYLPDTSDYRVVAVVRDPRDIIVSFFYSLAYAHTPSSQEFIDHAREAKENGIEWFVRQPERLEMVREPLEFYRREVWGKEGCFCWRYEDMMADFPAFAEGLEQHVTGGAAIEERDAIIAENAAQHAPKEGENLLSHRRSGRSGEFRSKLEPGTAEFLTEHFGELIDFYGYER